SPFGPASGGAVPFHPPQMIISVPVQTTVAYARRLVSGEVGTVVQVLVAGLYRPPSLSMATGPTPPQMIISEPVQMAVCCVRALGALSVDTGVHTFVTGL